MDSLWTGVELQSPFYHSSDKKVYWEDDIKRKFLLCGRY